MICFLALLLWRKLRWTVVALKGDHTKQLSISSVSLLFTHSLQTIIDKQLLLCPLKNNLSIKVHFKTCVCSAVRWLFKSTKEKIIPLMNEYKELFKMLRNNLYTHKDILKSGVSDHVWREYTNLYWSQIYKLGITLEKRIVKIINAYTVLR